MVDILEGTDDLSNRVSDLKNRVELHRMMAEYEKQNRLQQAQPENYYEVINDESFPGDYEEIPVKPPLFQRNFRQPGSSFQEERGGQFSEDNDLQNIIDELRESQKIEGQKLVDGSRSTSFRELAKSENIPDTNVQRFQIEEDIIPSFFTGKNEHHRRMFDFEDTDELPTVYLSPRDQLSNFRDDSPDDALYTEGGLVYVPGSTKNDATTNLLQNIMGFTRHERLDVKKPGPQPPQPPPSSQSPNEAPKVENLNLEQLPQHMKFDEPPKSKKQIHSDMDHANYSVDTEYAHVILKNSIDNWKEGVSFVAIRIVSKF